MTRKATSELTTKKVSMGDKIKGFHLKYRPQPNPDNTDWLSWLSSYTLPGILIISTLSILAFWNTLDNGFVWDDQYIVVANKAIRELSLPNIWDFFTSKDVYNFAAGDIYRPLSILSYAFEYRLYGLDSTGYHLTNLIIHTLNSILVYLTIGLISKDRLIAFVTSLLFVVHPIHTEAVAWVKERDELLTLLFFLLALYFYIRRSFNPQGSGQTLRPASTSPYILALLFYILALLSEEMAITLPFILILHDACFSVNRMRRPKDWLAYLPFFGSSGFPVGSPLWKRGVRGDL